MKNILKSLIKKNIKKNENNKILIVDPINENTFNRIDLKNFDIENLDKFFDNENLLINLTIDNDIKLIVIDLILKDNLIYSFELNSKGNLKKFFFELILPLSKNYDNINNIYLYENDIKKDIYRFNRFMI